MARPIAPPTWIAVSDTPETKPECSSLTPETADRVAGTNVIPSPIPTTISGSMAPLMYELWGVRLLSHSSPIAATAVPVAISGRTPVWTTSLETNPALAIMTTVKGDEGGTGLERGVAQDVLQKERADEEHPEQGRAQEGLDEVGPAPVAVPEDPEGH